MSQDIARAPHDSILKQRNISTTRGKTTQLQETADSSMRTENTNDVKKALKELRKK